MLTRSALPSIPQLRILAAARALPAVASFRNTSFHAVGRWSSDASIVAGWQHGSENGKKGARGGRFRMIVRVASVQVAPERIDEIVSRYREAVRDIHQQSEGLGNHYVLVDRQSGQMNLIGFWDSREALEATLPTLEPARERLWSRLEETPTLESYQVADRI